MLLTESERLEWLMQRRQDLERELRDAEILVDLAKKHVRNIDALVASIQEGQTQQQRGPHIERRPDAAPVCSLSAKTKSAVVVGRRSRGRRMTDAEKAEILDRFHAGNGQSARVIAKALDFTPASISLFLRKSGFDPSLTNTRRRVIPDGVVSRQNRILRMN